MNLKDVETRLIEIRKCADKGDDEAAHAREDSLREDVLRAIADGDYPGIVAARLAALALSSESFDFERWYA